MMGLPEGAQRGHGTSLTWANRGLGVAGFTAAVLGVLTMALAPSVRAENSPRRLRFPTSRAAGETHAVPAAAGAGLRLPCGGSRSGWFLAGRIPLVVDAGEGTPRTVASGSEETESTPSKHSDTDVVPKDTFHDVNPHRMRVGALLRAKDLLASSSNLLWLDANDPLDEVLAVPGRTSVHLVYRDGRRRNIAIEPQEPHATPSCIRLVSSGLDRRWLVAWQVWHTTPLITDSYAELYSDDGRRLWKYDPDPQGVDSYSMTVAVGDLSGDGRDEVVIGLTAVPARDSGHGGLVLTEGKGYLVVLDQQARVLARKVLPGVVHGVRVFADGPGKQRILCVTDRGMTFVDYFAGGVPDEGR